MAVELLTALTPINPGCEPALRETLRELPPYENSPFTRVTGTHVARWVVLDRLGLTNDPSRYPRLRPALLVFTAAFDGPLGVWLEHLRTGLDSTAEAVWSHCALWPGTADGSAFARWLVQHRIRHGVPFIAHPHATVSDVERGLDLRRRLSDFAVRAQGLEPAGLRQEWAREFGWS